jgi:hypothetical protein
LAEHLTQNQIEGYVGQKLPPGDLLSLSDHLVECETCRKQIEKLLGADQAFFTLHSEVFGAESEGVSTTVHPSSEQMAEYVDGVLTSEELHLVEDHLASCGPCELAINDLRIFRDEVAPQLDREYQPAHGHTTPESWWRHLVSFLPSPFSKSPILAFSSVIVLLLLTTTGWLIWRRAKETANRPELVVAIPSPTATPTTALVIPTPSPTVGPAPKALVAELKDGGGQVILDREGKLSGVEHLPPAYQRMVKESLISQQLERSSLLAGLNRPESLLKGGSDPSEKFSVIEPVGKVLQSNRPSFVWTRLAGATGYVVEVYDEAFNPVAISPQIVGNSWITQPLKSGGVYSWQVKAIKDGQEFKSPRPPAPQAKFRILDGARVSELQQARRAYASSHLILGLLYAQAGLLDEAEKEFRALQKANPDSLTVRKLLSQARQQRLMLGKL